MLAWFWLAVTATTGTVVCSLVCTVGLQVSEFPGAAGSLPAQCLDNLSSKLLSPTEGEGGEEGGEQEICWPERLSRGGRASGPVEAAAKPPTCKGMLPTHVETLPR